MATCLVTVSTEQTGVQNNLGVSIHFCLIACGLVLNSNEKDLMFSVADSFSR